MDEEGPRKPFAAFLQEQRGAVLHAELSDGLAELVRTARLTGKTGTLTLQIKVAPQKDGETLMVTDKVTVKLPEGERGGSLFFDDETGFISRRNPRQPELPFRDVSQHDEPAAGTAEGATA